MRYDILDICVPNPSACPSVSVRRIDSEFGRESAFGHVVSTQDLHWSWNGALIGKARTWSHFRGPALPSDLLKVATTSLWFDFSRAMQARDDQIEIVEQLLASQKSWVIWAERDADQHPVEFSEETPMAVAAKIRNGLDFCAWPPSV